MAKQEKFYITTPIYYVNDVPHIGHAYTTIAADVLARYWRMILGADNVHFLAGTDEHGAKIAQAAENKKMSPQEFVDEKAAKFQTIWDSLSISNNDFIRTTEKRHEKVVIEFLNKLKTAKTPKGNECFYEAEYEGLYCVGCEAFLTEIDLVDGKCPDHQTEPEQVKEKNWFFKLSDYGDKLKELIDKGELNIQPESRQNEILGLIKTGLKDVSISREQLEWGIKLPFDEQQVVYVWVEALMNYISALGGVKGDLYKKYWPANIHLMAKDILKFHAVIWPAILLALDIPLPELVYAHGFFTVDGQKMSKTIGNVISPDDLINQYGTDATRYLLLSQFGFGTDGDFSKERLDNIYQAALANELGNLVSRTFALTEKHFAGKVPKYNVDYDKFFEFDLQTDWNRYDVYMKSFQFDQALNVAWENVRRCNAYVDKEKPWELANVDRDVLADVMYNLLETIRQTAIMIRPFMPEISERILIQLGYEAEDELAKPIEDLRKWASLQLDQKIIKGAILFPRLDNK